MLADDRVSDADRHEDISRALAFSAGATAAVGRVSTTIWSGGAVAGLYLGTELILRFWVHTHYPGALGLREWIRVVLSWPLIFFVTRSGRG